MSHNPYAPFKDADEYMRETAKAQQDLIDAEVERVLEATNGLGVITLFSNPGVAFGAVGLMVNPAVYDAIQRKFEVDARGVKQ